MKRDLIWKVCRPSEWTAICNSGEWPGSSDDLRDGFIHLSTAMQLEATIQRHFAGAGNLVLLAIDPQMLGSQLRWEPSRNGDLFPHLYGPLTRSAIAHVEFRNQPSQDPAPQSSAGPAEI